jgi:hypothetical protein
VLDASDPSAGDDARQDEVHVDCVVGHARDQGANGPACHETDVPSCGWRR